MRTLLVSFFVFVCVLFANIKIYQLWEEQKNLDNFNQIIELNDASVIQVLSAPENHNLVPNGAILGVNDVTEVQYLYLVECDPALNTDIRITNIRFNHDGGSILDQYGLLIFETEWQEFDETHQILSLTVKLRMPDTEEQYRIVQSSTASFEVAIDRY